MVFISMMAQCCIIKKFWLFSAKYCSFAELSASNSSVINGKED
ncbi:hypothetical protein [Candidatus Harpocratesius sp.]